jgi:class 3 adenylate cyclase
MAVQRFRGSLRHRTAVPALRSVSRAPREAGMICPACRHDNRFDAKFCEQCGSALPRRCASCGVLLPPSASICDACARPSEPRIRSDAGPVGPPASYTPRHLATRILTSRSALEGERKQVAVLFCDLVDSTALAERLGSDAMHRLLDRFFTCALQEIHRYDGTVNQFLGDGLMALFGAPVAHEHHARQAVLAAQAVLRVVREELAEFRGTHGVAVAVRVALNTGPVVVGKIGDDLRMDYTAIGDTTNTAARLQQTADRDTALMSEATRVAAGEDVDVELLGLRALKGKSEPVRVYKLVAVGRRTGDGARRLRSQLVGRAHSRLARSGGEPAGIDAEHVGVAENHRPLDYVLQLANVAGPVIGLEQIEGLLADAANPLAGLPRVPFHEIFHQQWNVAPHDREAPVRGSERRSADRTDPRESCRP